MFRTINSAGHWILLQSDIERIQGSCTGNFMKLIVSKTRVTVFTRKKMFSITLIKYVTLL